MPPAFELIGTVMCSFNYLVWSQCQLICSLLYTVLLTYHFTLHDLKEMKDILLGLFCNLVVMFTWAHNDKIACLFYICLPMIWMMSYYVHPTLNLICLRRIYNFWLFHANLLQLPYTFWQLFILFLGLTYWSSGQCQSLPVACFLFRRNPISNGVQTG